MLYYDSLTYKSMTVRSWILVTLPQRNGGMVEMMEMVEYIGALQKAEKIGSLQYQRTQ